MSILTLDKASLAFGHTPLLQNVDFQIDKGERVCLLGRNGAGKSTLFRVISRQAELDDGELWQTDTLRISYLEQEVPAQIEKTIYEVIATGLGELGNLLAEYHQTTLALELDKPGAMQRLNELQQKIEVQDGWNLNQKVEMVLSKLDLPADKKLGDCSGGIRRRVMLARALVSEPDLLLLDEPTNHMDIAAIQWLEEFLKAFKGALIFITHDRTFLRNLATRIVELDRGVLTSFPGNYEQYLKRKEEMLEAEDRANAKFDKQLAEEEVWIRQGVKARRTRNEGRVRRLESMRQERQQRLGQQGKATLDMDSGDKSGKLVADLRHVNFSYNQHAIVKDFSTRIMRGDRIGIIGPNGSGKSTLIKLILGELEPQSGTIVLGTKLEIGYFDQHRDILDPNKTVRENMSEGRDHIMVRGKSRHVISYLRDFLFPPQRIDSPVKILSGGERNRLLLAKLFTQSANMLVLDEPTNDLDVDTLELLEELLNEFDGTLLLVSHDRTFLDNVVTSTMVFEGDGNVQEYVGGYDDWLRQTRVPVFANQLKAEKRSSKPEPEKAVVEKSKKKLSYKEQRELDELPQRIESLEQEQSQLQQTIAQPEFYQQDKDIITETLERMECINKELTVAFERWEFLDTL